MTSLQYVYEIRPRKDCRRNVPTQIEEAYATAKWVAAHGNDIGVNGSRMAAAGNSVGGNMSAVIALMAKDRGGPKTPTPSPVLSGN